MARARIFRPAKTAMQSGRHNTKKWHLEFEPAKPRSRDSLMGWTSSADMKQEVRMEFETQEEAIAFCKRNGLDYVIHEPHKRQVKPKSYSDNFRWDRVR